MSSSSDDASVEVITNTPAPHSDAESEEADLRVVDAAEAEAAETESEAATAEAQHAARTIVSEEQKEADAGKGSVEPKESKESSEAAASSSDAAPVVSVSIAAADSAGVGDSAFVNVAVTGATTTDNTETLPAAALASPAAASSASASGRVGLIGAAAAASLSALDWRLLRWQDQLKSDLQERPKQTGFRVFSILVYKPKAPPAAAASSVSTDISSTHPFDNHNRISGEDNLAYVTGTNTEVCHIGTSICSERSAFLQMRMKRYEEVTKLYITADSEGIITPGLLCREFMLEFMSLDTPIVLASKNAQLEHGFDVQVATLRELFPFPSIFLNVPGSTVQDFAKQFHSKAEKFAMDFASEPSWVQLNEAVVARTAKDTRPALHPISYAAGVLFSDGSSKCVHATKLLEYGWSLDAVVKLVPFLEDAREKGAEPVLILLADQFANLHSPSAPARAHLAEYRYDPLLVFHTRDGKLVRSRPSALAPDVPDLIEDVLPTTVKQSAASTHNANVIDETSRSASASASAAPSSASSSPAKPAPVGFFSWPFLTTPTTVRFNHVASEHPPLWSLSPAPLNEITKPLVGSWHRFSDDKRSRMVLHLAANGTYNFCFNRPTPKEGVLWRYVFASGYWRLMTKAEVHKEIDNMLIDGSSGPQEVLQLQGEKLVWLQLRSAASTETVWNAGSATPTVTHGIKMWAERMMALNFASLTSKSLVLRSPINPAETFAQGMPPASGGLSETELQAASEIVASRQAAGLSCSDEFFSWQCR